MYNVTCAFDIPILLIAAYFTPEVEYLNKIWSIMIMHKTSSYLFKKTCRAESVMFSTITPMYSITKKTQKKKRKKKKKKRKKKKERKKSCFCKCLAMFLHTNNTCSIM